MEYNFNKGSEWRKWDLHIHSNASDGKSSPHEIIQEAKRKGLSVIALTDHHTTKNIDTIKQLGKEDGISIISGIEFRTEYGQKSVHLIGLFPDTFNGIELTSKALHDLILSPLNLSETQIISKGRDRDTGFSNEKAFKEGMFLVQVSFKEAANLIHKYGGVVSVHAGSKSNSFDEEMKHLGKGEKNVKELFDSLGTVKEELFKNGYIDICEIKRENDSEEFYLKAFNKPSIIASDAHETIQIGDKFTWIKAEPTFEGLKQIICEPEIRVKIQGSNPEDKKLYNIIEKVRFVDNSGLKKFSNYDIGFNPGLNAIIGGKSSGKSLLMHLIAKSLGNGRDTKEYTNVVNKVDLEVFYADEPEVKRTSNDRRIIEFLPQLYIEKIVQGKSESQNSNDHFNTFISDLIKQDDDIKALFDEHNAFIEERTKQISENITNWVKLDRALIQAKKELLPLGDKSAINSEILKIEEQVKELTKNSGLTTEQIEQYQSLTKERSVVLKDIEILNTDETETSRLMNYLEYSLEAIIGKAIYFDTKSTSTLALFNEIKESLKAALLAEASKSIFDLDLKIGEYSTLKQQKQSRLTEIQTLLGPILEKNKIQTEIKVFEENIVLEKKKVAIIEEKEKEVLSIKEARDGNTFVNYYSEIIQSYNNLKNKINEKISSKWDREQTKLTLIASSIFNNENFVESISSIINVKSFLQNQFEDCGFSASTYKFKESSHIVNISKILNKCISDRDRFNNFKNGRTTEELLRALFKDCTYLDFDIKKGEDSIRNMSEGKKGIVILQLYLSLSKADYPILIDQPEDNLDNRTVYIELNDYIKKCKEKRQIIMVSHNANLVVNTDAENIIVANQMGEDEKDNKEFRFEYVNGALEKTFEDDNAKGILYKKGIREHVCEILEGGTDAFKKREEKYHLNK